MTFEKYAFFISIICLLTFSGCASVRQIPDNNVKAVVKLSDFDGTYSPFSESDTISSRSLWSKLNYDDVRDTISNFSQSNVVLRSLSEDKIEASLLHNGQVRSTMLLSGKLKNNHFVFKRKLGLKGLPPLLVAVSNQQTQISLSEGNQLVLNGLDNRWGWALFFFASKDDAFSLEYEKTIPTLQ